MANIADIFGGRKPVTDSKDELRILLIGKTGDGKSATGNTILGNDDSFKSTRSPSSVTKQCSFAYGERFGRKMLVVDTPGLCDTNLTNTEIKMELIRSLGLTVPGFHVIAFVLREGRFTRECSETKRLFFEWFGSNVNEHALIILTHWDVRKGDPAKYFDESPELKDFKETCGNRVVAFENKGSTSDKEVQVKKLLTVIDEVMHNNDGTHFSTIAFRLVHKYIRAAETPVIQWLQQKLFSSKEETEVSSEEVKESDAIAELETAIKTETYETVTSHTETADKPNLADVSASCSKEEKKDIEDKLDIYEDVNPPHSEYKSETTKFTDNSFRKVDVSSGNVKNAEKTENSLNVQSFGEEPKTALETKSKTTDTPPTEAAENPNLAVVPAPCSKEEKQKTVDDSPGDVKDAKNPGSSLHAQSFKEVFREKFMDNAFLKRFVKIFDWALEKVMKKNKK